MCEEYSNIDIVFLITMCLEWFIWVYIFIRNFWVCSRRSEILENSKWEGFIHKPYDLLPSYNEMLIGHGFWIWDIKYYLPKEEE